ncbi:MAG: nitrilase-related carbon-nitrogen hydrolase [Promethearchaeota archaeon]
MFKVAYVQTNPVFGDKMKNIEKASEMIIQSEYANLYVLPELFSTGYAFVDKKEVHLLAEEIPEGDTTQRLMNLAKRKDTHIVAGLAEKDKSRIFNSAIAVGPEGLFMKYRKIHLFYKEKNWFDPGDIDFRISTIEDARIGIIICFDWIFPEAIRTLALKGADLICHPSNLLFPYAQRAMLTRSVENRVYTVTANRIGIEDRNGNKFNFTGMNQITSPKMELLMRASENKEEVGISEIDVRLSRDKAITPLNDIFEDRKTAFYSIS